MSPTGPSLMFAFKIRGMSFGLNRFLHSSMPLTREAITTADLALGQAATVGNCRSDR